MSLTSLLEGRRDISYNQASKTEYDTFTSTEEALVDDWNVEQNYTRRGCVKHL